MTDTGKRTKRTDGTYRPTLDDVFMRVACAVAQRSTCPTGARHGAVLVYDGHIVATGYGSPACGVRPCSECWLRKKREETGDKDWDVCPSVHAEANAVAMAAKRGIAIEGADVYVTAEPCRQCLRLLHNCGVFHYFVYQGEDSVPTPYRIGSKMAAMASPMEPGYD